MSERVEKDGSRQMNVKDLERGEKNASQTDRCIVERKKGREITTNREDEIGRKERGLRNGKKMRVREEENCKSKLSPPPSEFFSSL